MATDIKQSLISANARIRLLLLASQPPGRNVSVIQPHDICGLAQDMARVGQVVRELPREISDSDLRREMDEYRGNVERLGQVLPSVQGWLLAERARLHAARSHLAAAAAWAHACNKTR
jgi:hypothetical protein